MEIKGYIMKYENKKDQRFNKEKLTKREQVYNEIMSR